MKASRKLFLLRYWNSVFITISRWRATAAARRVDEIHLIPVRPRGCGGHVDEYFHFVFDLVLPLWHLLRRTEGVSYTLERFGVNSERLLEIFPERVRFISEVQSTGHLYRLPLIGMNPKGVLRREGGYEGLRDYICAERGFGSTSSARKSILLIERVAPDKEFTSRATVTRSGTLRRSITNHRALHDAIASSLQDDEYELHNLTLEKLSFAEQVERFSGAFAVIAQHGAGLSNCIWMEPGSTVIELNHMNNITHFNMVSQAKGHHYAMYLTDSAHATIDTRDFIGWLARDSRLGPLFI